MELIKITEQNGQGQVSGKELHQVLKPKTQFNHWIKRMLEYGFEQGADYQTVSISQKRPITDNQLFANSGGDKRSLDYILTIGCAKEIAMLQKNEKGREIRKYFIAKEKEAQALSIMLPPPATYNGIACIHVRVLTWCVFDKQR